MLWVTITLLAPGLALADGARLTVTPSSTEIAADENISLEMTTETDGGSSGTPKYDAPDFDEINTYSAGISMGTYVINGHVTVRNSKTIVVVLHPRRQGRLAIRNFRVDVGGQVIRTPDIAIDVRQPGGRLARNSPGAGYPPSSNSKMPSNTPHSPSQQHVGSFFIRTEPNKLRVYKGEQVILTYALYTRVSVMNIAVERYPNPTGFLKEDIDIPLLKGRLDYTPSVVNGYEYRRAVLAQYAIFPLKDGQLPIDTFTAKIIFQVGTPLGGDDDDPFAMLSNFLSAARTTTETRTSDRPTIEVLPLPLAGQPANFSGLVGDFNITAVVDKTTVKAGEPVNVKVKVEGRGHAGSLEKLAVQWPKDFELYEDKSNTQFMRTGESERLFEYMVIPKTKGRYEIPPIELSMFNPDSKTYQTQHTQPITIEVLEGNTGTVYVPKTGKDGGDAVAQNGTDIRYWKDDISAGGSPMLRSVARAMAAASMALAMLSLWSLGSSPDKDQRQSHLKAAQAMRERAHALKKSTAAPVEILGEVEGLLARVLEHRTGVAIGSLTRAEAARALLDRKIDETTAKRVESLIELVETQRYAPGGGDRAGATKAVEELTRIVERLA